MSKHIYLKQMLDDLRDDIQNIKDIFHDCKYDTIGAHILEQYASKMLLILEAMKSQMRSWEDE